MASDRARCPPALYQMQCVCVCVCFLGMELMERMQNVEKSCCITRKYERSKYLQKTYQEPLFN